VDELDFLVGDRYVELRLTDNFDRWTGRCPLLVKALEGCLQEPLERSLLLPLLRGQHDHHECERGGGPLQDALLSLGRRETVGGTLRGLRDPVGRFALMVVHRLAENCGVRSSRTSDDGHDDFPGRVGSAFVLRSEARFVGSDE